MTRRAKGFVHRGDHGRKIALGRTRAPKSTAGSDHDERRAQVYAPERLGIWPDEKSAPLPPRGPERDALAERLRELKAAGATHLQAAAELDIEAAQVSVLCREYDIRSASTRGRPRRKGYDSV